MTFGSLFTGFGGLDLGLERAGLECRWQVECEPYAVEIVLAKNWPKVKRYRDVRWIGADSLQRLERVDLIAGGFPCQDVSGAGRGVGIDAGTRSGLWREFARLIRELRPSFALVENVGALRSRGLDRVLGDLAESGYDAEWETLSSAAFGAPHIRERVFILAYPAGFGRNVLREGWAQSDRGALDSCGYEKAERDENWEHVKPSSRNCIARLWTPQPGVLRVLDGVPYRMERLRGLGNAVQVEIGQWIGEKIVNVLRRA